MADFAPSDTRLLYALRRAHLVVEARKQERLQQLDLLPAHYAVLINVWAHPGVTGAELARHVGVTPQNIANLVGRLIRRDLLVRTPHPAHAHVLEVRLTDRGAALLREADAQVADIEREVVQRIGQDAAEALTAVLDAIRS